MSKREKTGLEIAVIGMSGRFPKSKNIDEFWINLKEGKEGIHHNGIDQKEKRINAKGHLEDNDCFDYNFFDYINIHEYSISF